jgi:hypothetical protein
MSSAYYLVLGERKRWVARGCFYPWWARVGMSSMGQFNSDMALDRTAIHVCASNYHIDTSFFTSLFDIFPHCYKKYMSVVCRFKINHENEVRCAFILGLLAAIRTLTLLLLSLQYYLNALCFPSDCNIIETLF